MKAIDLFAGAGGLSLGMKQASWEVVGALEIWPEALATHRVNMPDVAHICDDIRDVDFTAFRGVDLVAGGPPCQPFSVSGKQLGAGDVRDMLPEFLRAVEEARPHAFLMENVQGLTTPRFRTYLAAHVAKLSKLGYEVHWKVLNAADFGVPQNRRRLFIVGLPPGINYDFPTPTHGTAECPFATVRGALLDAPADEANTAKVVYAKNPVLRRSPFAGMLLNGKGRPLNLDAPSNTIPATAGGNRTHVLDPDGVLTAYHKGLLRGDAARTGLVPGCRRLTVRESARLQTFPDWFEIKGRKSQQYAQVGNAVPPMLAKVVAASIREALNSGDVQTYAAEPIPHYV